MKYFVAVMLISVLLKKVESLCETSAFEPCLSKNNKELPYPVYTRHPSIDYSSSTDDPMLGDLFALNHGQWYRSNYNMTNYCVDHRKCGTSEPIYLDGSIPSLEEGVVDRHACVRTFENCCEHKLKIRIRNCKYFMVYCFIDLHFSCHSRFCFDVDLSVETTTTTTTTTTTKISTSPLTTTSTNTTRTTPATTPATTPSTTPSSTVTRPETTTGRHYLPHGNTRCGDEDNGTVTALAIMLVISVIGHAVVGVLLYRTKRKDCDNMATCMIHINQQRTSVELNEKASDTLDDKRLDWEPNNTRNEQKSDQKDMPSYETLNNQKANAQDSKYEDLKPTQDSKEIYENFPPEST